MESRYTLIIPVFSFASATALAGFDLRILRRAVSLLAWLDCAFYAFFLFLFCSFLHEMVFALYDYYQWAGQKILRLLLQVARRDSSLP
jgi:hypothetical protein